MSWIKKISKIILVNLIVFLILFASLFVTPLSKNLKSFIGLTPQNQEKIPTHNLPNYKSSPWAKKHFDEFKKLSVDYFDFIGWRRKSFKGDTITIDEQGFRRHDKNISSSEARVWMFGGSAMWGTGSNDELTIPAYLEKNSGFFTFNYGESGYTSHQSLNLLMKAYLSGGRPDYVVFYDGVNDVAHKCRSELNYFSTEREVQIREKLQKKNRFLLFIKSIFYKNNKNVSMEKIKPFNCETDSAKVSKIASALILDWKTAKFIVESNGGKFIPILQPVSYIGSPRLDHISHVVKNSSLKKQFEVVYPAIKKQLKNDNFNYLDFTNLFNSNDYIYIDFCHVSPNGNKIISDNISKFINDKSLR